MKIHPIISIAHLEPHPNEEDPFERPRPHEPPPISAVDDDAPEYEIERLLGKRISGRKIQYLVKWKGYNHYWNRWYDVQDLNKAQQLIKDYEDHQAARPSKSKAKAVARSKVSVDQKVKPVVGPALLTTKLKRGRPPRKMTTGTGRNSSTPPVQVATEVRIPTPTAPLTRPAPTSAAAASPSKLPGPTDAPLRRSLRLR